MIEYTVLTAASGGDLAELVNGSIAQGWVPHGGVAVSSYYASWENERKGYQESEQADLFAQAMTRTAPVSGEKDHA